MNIQIAIENLVNYGHKIGQEHYKTVGFMALKVHEGAYLLTKSGADLKFLKETDISGFNMNEGKIGRLFKHRTEINSVIFLRTDTSIKMSEKTNMIRPSLDDLAQIIGVDVKVAANFDDETLLDALKNRNGCYIKGQGLLAMGRSLEETFAAARIMEKSAYVELMSKGIGEIRHIGKLDCVKMNKFYKNTYSQTNKTPMFTKLEYDEAEAVLRQEIVDCGINMVDEGLVQGTWGNISCRLDDRFMLVTPSGMDYHSLTPDDIVKVDINTFDYGSQRKPTSEKGIHSALLKMKPECNAVIHTHSHECSVYAATGKTLIADEELSKLTKGDVIITPHAMPGSKKLTRGVSKAMKNCNACIMANHGVVCSGEDLRSVLNMCRKLEETANKEIIEKNRV